MKTPAMLVIVAAMAALAAPAEAQLGSRAAKDWIATLERPERVAGLKTADVVATLDLKAGNVVADIGAGAGVFSWPLARAVAPGTVYAVEVDKAFIPHLEGRAREQGLANVTPVLGKFEDPLLPRKVDLAFFHDVLHHIGKRAEYLKTVAGYLAPGGRIAVIEFDATNPQTPHRGQPDQQVTKEQLHDWLTAAGLKKLEEIPLFDDKWFVIYGKP